MYLSVSVWRLRVAVGCFLKLGVGLERTRNTPRGWRSCWENQTENLIVSTYNGRCALGGFFVRPGNELSGPVGR